ncbi:MAG: hypothetical protein NVS4B11_26980 [Ktedonobacteraceae bacterium]
MKTLEEFLAEKREITIHTLTSYTRQYLRAEWHHLLQEHQEELAQTFDKAGEYAYGVFFRMLCQPMQEQMTQAGFLVEPGYPGDFRSTSVEYWGPPEERERCLWCVVRTANGTPLGAIVTQVFHDHTGFRIPQSPGVFAIEETEPAAIVEALSHASVRLQGREHGAVASPYQPQTMASGTRPGWEYSIEVGLADTIDSDRIEVSESLLDGSLALWGRYGWELVTVIPHQQRMIAFFKRPAKGTI